jgi:hypothetical protein
MSNRRSSDRRLALLSGGSNGTFASDSAGNSLAPAGRDAVSRVGGEVASMLERRGSVFSCARGCRSDGSSADPSVLRAAEAPAQPVAKLPALCVARLDLLRLSRRVASDLAGISALALEAAHARGSGAGGALGRRARAAGIPRCVAHWTRLGALACDCVETIAITSKSERRVYAPVRSSVRTIISSRPSRKLAYVVSSIVSVCTSASSNNDL